VTSSVLVLTGPNFAAGPPVPSRESITRGGVTPWNPPPASPLVPTGPNHPTTSASTSTLPLLFNRDTLPEALTLTTTRFGLILTVTRLGAISPGAKLRFDASGWARPDGHTVRNDGADGSTAVTLSSTPDTPLAGTPPTPVTSRSRVSPAVNFACGPPVPSRV